jgi:carbamoyltransferase
VFILGISAFYHDSAACLLDHGRLIAACEEERFSRRKHDSRFPAAAVQFCLEYAGITMADVACVAFYDKPLRKFRRLMTTYLDYAPSGLESWLAAIPEWIGGKLSTPARLRRLSGFHGQVVFTEHHEAHAASAFFPSPFSSAAILTMDGVGEWATTAFGVGHDNDIELFAELHFPHSLGLLYSAFTYYTGFRVNSGEYKLMGLAPYGEPRYRNLILDRLGDFREDGSLRLDMRYFNYCDGLTMTTEAFHSLFGGPPRAPETPVTARDMDIARSIQEVTELCVLRAAKHVHRETVERRLSMAGGLALNCVANGKLSREGPFDEIWIQPAAGDSGGAIGAATSAWHQYYGEPRSVKPCACAVDSMRGSYLGPAFSEAGIRALLERSGVPYIELQRDELLRTVAARLAGEQVVGWFQGPMEFGPRALGNRSILADPRSPQMQSVLNLKIKFRESFRPFAPSVLEERATEFFDLTHASPYMLFTAPIKEGFRLQTPEGASKLQGLDRLRVPRSTLPAITHVDCSARVQTVARDQNPLFYDLIKAFDDITGYPVLINTSFNVRGEPIVGSPRDALLCFARTNIDLLVMGNCVVPRSKAINRMRNCNAVLQLD